MPRVSVREGRRGAEEALLDGAGDEANKQAELRRQLLDARRIIAFLASEANGAVPDIGSRMADGVLGIEERLRASERILHAVFEGARDAFLLSDDSGICVGANPAACELYGLSRVDLIGRSVADFVDAAFELGPAWRRFLAEGSMAGQFVLARPDGLRRNIEFAATAHIIPGLHLSVLRDVTERLRTERRFQAMIERSQEGIALVDDKAVVTYFSPAVERISGYGPAEIVGRASFDIVVPEERERIGGVLSELLDRPGATRTVEFRIEHRDGSRRWVQSTATNLLEDPDIRAVVANFRDVTDRHRAVDELRESEERYRRIVEGTSEGVALMDSEGRITFANGRLADMLRYPREELLGRLASEFGPPESRRELEEKLARGMRGESGAHERPFLRRDGSSVWLELDVSPLFDANGNAEGALGLFRDVSSRRRAEEMRNRLAAIVESSDDAIIGLDLDGTVTSWNRGAERLYQREAEAMIGQPVAVLTPPDLRGEQGELLARIRDGERVLHRETRRLRADGSTVEVALTIWPIHDSSGRIAGISKIARNLTERRKAEAAVRRTEEQLRQAQKMEAVGSLAGGVAHDFNNLLSVILSYATMLSDSLTPGDPMRTDLEEIVKAGSRATDLTRQLLAFSRQQLLQPRVVDLNTIVANMQGMLRRVLGEHIELTMLMAQSLGKIFADPGQIEQVVMNLIVNARDAMPMGGKLTIETANAELDAEYAASHHGVTPGHYVMLAVTDGGIGMEPAVKARIFEPFFTTKGVGKGTGLGLSTVLGIVQQTGGHVWVYSEPGSGTTFRVYLPRTDRTAEQAPMPARTAEAIRGAETVLLVEDEEQVRRTMQLILRRHGYNVLEAENGGDALLLCEQYPATIHLLLTDVVMPRMNGRHLAERLATVRPHMKVLYVSGYTENAIVRHGILDAGIQYLSKPITPDALLRRVREVLDGSGSRRPSRP